MGLLGCDGGSPSEVHPGVPSAVTLAFADPTGALEPHEATIRSAVESTFERSRARIPIEGLTVLVSNDPPRAIRGWGIGGFAHGPARIEITVDPSFDGLEHVLAERVALAAAHEMHHAARFRGPGYGTTLFEAIVSEGLADQFSLEILGGPVPPWVDAFPVAQTARLWRLAEPELDGPYDHPRWFFGQDLELPRWTGYTLGFRLVGDYLAGHGSTAAELVHAPASRFRSTIPRS